MNLPNKNKIPIPKKIGRNDVCPYCDSGRHYKSCCKNKVEAMRFFQTQLERALYEKLLAIHYEFYKEIPRNLWLHGVKQVTTEGSDKSYSYFYGKDELINVRYTEDNKIIADVMIRPKDKK